MDNGSYEMCLNVFECGFVLDVQCHTFGSEQEVLRLQEGKLGEKPVPERNGMDSRRRIFLDVVGDCPKWITKVQCCVQVLRGSQ